MGTKLKLFHGSLGLAAAQRRFILRALAVGAACSGLALTYGATEHAAAKRIATQTFAVHAARGVSAKWLRRSEQAIEKQSLTVRAHWHTPLVDFGRDGWPIYVRRARDSGKPGWHDVRDGRPYAVVATRTWALPAGIFDHEVLEMLVDPYLRRFVRGKLAEICDRVVGHRYTAGNGAVLVDWVYPSYFRDVKAGPWDYLRLLTGGAR
ncbi:MAG: hypothetical protein JO321_06095 [Solirubrobacterales bacterium]|nr:hypothetical protein [Solirubrobacterales bacterium]MBV9164626.1 hypothetical protein [Solirubrobacterales bacterium]MBV9534970.1 hypothetical protein [Solirubrobacterales bacterium]